MHIINDIWTIIIPYMDFITNIRSRKLCKYTSKQCKKFCSFDVNVYKKIINKYKYEDRMDESDFNIINKDLSLSHYLVTSYEISVDVNILYKNCNTKIIKLFLNCTDVNFEYFEFKYINYDFLDALIELDHYEYTRMFVDQIMKTHIDHSNLIKRCCEKLIDHKVFLLHDLVDYISTHKDLINQIIKNKIHKNVRDAVVAYQNMLDMYVLIYEDVDFDQIKLIYKELIGNW
jgi:hypothetical protein